MNFSIKLFRRQSKGGILKVSENNCPNCWGDQEYDGMIRKKYRDPQISVNNHLRNYTFIKKFIVTYLSGIKLKNNIYHSGYSTCITPKEV